MLLSVLIFLLIVMIKLCFGLRWCKCSFLRLFDSFQVLFILLFFLLMIWIMCEKFWFGLRGMENVSISVVVLLSWILERFSNVSVLLVFCCVSFCCFGVESFVEFVFFEEVVLVILEGVFFFIVVGVLLLLLYFVSVSISM